MQSGGRPKFLKFHQSCVRAVAFSPTDRYLFCTGGYDGKVIIYSAMKGEVVTSYQLGSSTLAKNINVVRYNCSGTKVLTATSGKRVSVLDVEKGIQMASFNNCIFGTRESVGLSTSPVNPEIAICVAVSGKGLTLLDLRMSLPADFLYDVHNTIIRDVRFVPPSWPWSRGDVSSFLAVGNDGVCKVVDSTSHHIFTFYSGQDHLSSFDFTPETYSENSRSGFFNVAVFAGNCITSYSPERGVFESFYEKSERYVRKVRYATNGGMLYALCGDGKVRKFRRYNDHHEYLGKLLYYNSEANDLDVSLYSEYAAVAYKDKSVALMCLGMPSHGSTEYFDLT